MLTIAVSSRSLFDLEEANEIFEKKGQAAYDTYMRETESDKLEPGVAFELVRKFLLLNRHAPEGERLVNVMMLSRNSPEGGRRILKSVETHGLDIERAVFTAGGNRFKYAQAMSADLFLSANPSDAALALQNNLAAASIVPKARKANSGLPPRSDDVVRIAFDGDAVLFSDEADLIYRAQGLASFVQHELEKAEIPLGEGPFKKLLEKLSHLQQVLSVVPDVGRPPLRIALVTARGAQSHGRVLNTLRSWGITVDELVFASGAEKGPLLKAFGADIFFDDTKRHVESAHEHNIAAGHVPFGSGGIGASKDASNEATRLPVRRAPRRG